MEGAETVAQYQVSIIFAIRYVPMGGLWYSLTILGLGMTYCILKTVIDTMHGKGGHHH